MNTPICDFVKKYANSKSLRLHMPGHKGKKLVGVESIDITEIDGADSLYSANGIILKSQENASKLFCAHTFYSAEGSSLSIRAMIYTVIKYAKTFNLSTTILAGRNAHSSFISACAFSGADIDWICDNNNGYLTCNIDDKELDEQLSKYEKKPVAVYVTSPDYLGNLTDVEKLSKVCKAHGCLLLVDNAHGAYLKFLNRSLHPIDLGADMCADSAHKTLPTLTGGAYLHVNKSANPFFKENVSGALALFGSTSPSYLILQSLDLTNKVLSNNFTDKLEKIALKVKEFKQYLISLGFNLLGEEPLKVVIKTKEYGYLGTDFSKLLKQNNIVVEFYDSDFVVLMFSAFTSIKTFNKLKKVFNSIPKKQKILSTPPTFKLPKKILSVLDAIIKPSKLVSIDDAKGKIISNLSISCPPAVPIIISGELIDDDIIKVLKYYNITKCSVVL